MITMITMQIWWNFHLLFEAKVGQAFSFRRQPAIKPIRTSAKYSFEDSDDDDDNDDYDDDDDQPAGRHPLCVL